MEKSGFLTSFFGGNVGFWGQKRGLVGQFVEFGQDRQEKKCRKESKRVEKCRKNGKKVSKSVKKCEKLQENGKKLVNGNW